MDSDKYTIEFETVIRGSFLHVEAWILADAEGIYNTGFKAYLDEADVTGLLTEEDAMQIENEAQLHWDYSE